MYKAFFVLAGLAIQLVICSPVYAQNTCDAVSLDSAKYRYDIGKLDECIEGLSRCLSDSKNFIPEQKVQACQILAKCYLALDETSKADSVLNELLALNENFEPDPDDPESLKKKVSTIKAGIVSSVSKFSEDIKIAPATVMVISREEILQRGYTDLIEILKDIPGFDISIYYGQLYANVYQRGFRSNNTDKILLLIDGVEDNDLWSNFADISQQYPLTNIKRVEVIYGPASTMYGPNAFSGVINVITKDPVDYLQNNRSFGFSANAGIGTFSTKYAEASAGYKKGLFSFTTTARIYYSDRPDLSSQTLWDYDSTALDSLEEAQYRTALRTPNGKNYIDSFDLPENHPFFRMRNDTLIVTPQGITEAKWLDKQLPVQGKSGFDYTAFVNPSKAFFLNAKVNISDFSFGFITWSKTEGIGTTYTDWLASVSGSEWRPAHHTAFVNYNKRINNKLRFSAFLNYKVHVIRNGSKITTIKRFAPLGTLELKDLVNEVPAHWLTTYYFQQSEQYRSEFKLLYTRNKYFYLISGLELRSSQLRGYYLTDTISPVPQNTGTYPYPNIPGGNYYNIKDLGIYSQGNYRTKNGWGFTVGLRFDHNEIRHGGGLGSQLNPRIVVDYSKKKWVLKAIMSKGVQNISNYTKFDDVILRPNPSLTFESIYNYELYIKKNIATAFEADIDFFYQKIDNVVGAVLTRRVLQNENIGAYTIKGVQSNLYYKPVNKKWQIALNYTYTDPWQTKDNDTTVDLKVADIASHKLNAIANIILWKNLNINIRVNYVGKKRAGEGITVPRNINDSFDDYIIGNMTVGLQNLVKGGTMQLVCNNIFNKPYYSPGIRPAGSVRAPDKILQMGRVFFFKINYEF